MKKVEVKHEEMNQAVGFGVKKIERLIDLPRTFPPSRSYLVRFLSLHLVLSPRFLCEKKPRHSDLLNEVFKYRMTAATHSETFASHPQIAFFSQFLFRTRSTA
jgi:hypothetical protein